MDWYEEHMQTFEITPMPESYKAVRGQYTPPTGQTHVDVGAVKNSWAQINLAIRMPCRAILLLEERPTFAHHLPIGDVTVLRASITAAGLSAKLRLVDVVSDDDGVAKADVILENGEMEVRAHQTNQMVALIDVPAGTPAGDYQGSIRFFAHSMFYDERLAREITFTVHVADVELPAAPEQRFYLNLWQHVFNIARKCEVEAYTPAHIEALRPYAKALGELGNRVTTVVLSDVPWRGQQCYNDAEAPCDLYEYNYVRIRRGVDGAFRYDFSFAEAYIDLMAAYGATDVMLTGLYGVWVDEKEGFDCFVEGWPDAIRVSYIDERTGALCFMRRREEIEDYIRAVYDWIVARGMLPYSYLMGDEVNLGSTAGEWTRVLETIHRLMPDIRMDWDMGPKDIMNDTYRNERVDVYTPQIDLLAVAEPELLRATRERLQPGGKYLWSVCCYPPVMNSFLYTNLCEVRLHGLITEKLKLDGFIRWNFTVWPDDPRADLSFHAPGWPAGDTCFVYPGNGGQCLLSLRYLALKRGIEDYELAQMVKARVRDGEKIVDEAVEGVLNEGDLSKWDFVDYHGREKYMSLNDADYQAAREKLVRALENA